MRPTRSCRPVTGKLRTDHDSLREEYLALVGSHEQLRSDHDELAGELESLRTAVAEMRYAVISFESKGLFGVNAVSQDAVDRAVQLKTENPAMTRSEISAQLSSEGLDISNNALQSTLRLYFSSYE